MSSNTIRCSGCDCLLIPPDDSVYDWGDGQYCGCCFEELESLKKYWKKRVKNIVESKRQGTRRR